MMSKYANSSRRVQPESLKIDPTARPGWQSGTDHPFCAGDQVYCTEGPAEVTRVLGKTQNGSRLLELRILDGRREPFFAAASNILVAPAVESAVVANRA